MVIISAAFRNPQEMKIEADSGYKCGNSIIYLRLPLQGYFVGLGIRRR